MKIAIASDHAGFLLKQRLRQRLLDQGHEVTDHGADSREPSDYPDFAAAVARAVAAGRVERGILVCSTGIGMAIAANKVPGVRAALGTSPEEVRLVRGHNDANILTLGANFIEEEDAAALVEVFLTAGFDGGRHARRLAKVAELEHSAAVQDEPQVTQA